MGPTFHHHHPPVLEPIKFSFRYSILQPHEYKLTSISSFTKIKTEEFVVMWMCFTFCFRSTGPFEITFIDIEIKNHHKHIPTNYRILKKRNSILFTESNPANDFCFLWICFLQDKEKVLKESDTGEQKDTNNDVEIPIASAAS